jgi:hypothetical protein
MVSAAEQGQVWLGLGWETDLQRRLLRDKQFGIRGEMLSKFNGVTHYRPLKNSQGREDERNGSYACMTI